MRARKAMMPVLLGVFIVVTGCSSNAKRTSDRHQPDVRCAHYQFERPTDMVDGNPVLDGIKGTRKTDTCKMEIVAMQDIDTHGTPQWPPRRDLVGLPTQVTDEMWVRQWRKVESDQLKKKEYWLLPAYAFQCNINQVNDPTFECSADIAASHKLSTYTDLGFEISGGAMTSPQGVTINFGGGASQKDLLIRETAGSRIVTLDKTNNTMWTGVLSLHTEWEKVGIADVCFDSTESHCDIVRARIIHSEDLFVENQTQSWPLLVHHMRTQINRPLFNQDQIKTPELPLSSQHSDYDGGPQRIVLGGAVKGLTASWKNTDSSLRKQNLNGKLDLGFVKMGTGSEGGRETEVTSSATITYKIDPLKPVIEEVRCMEILSIGGKESDGPITGIILKEGCSY